MSAAALLQTIALAALALAGSWALLVLLGRRNSATDPDLGDSEGTASFLFDGTRLVDLSETARAWLGGPAGSVDLDGFAARLSPRFAGLDQAIAELPETGFATLEARDGTSLLRLEWRSGRLWAGLIRDAERPDSVAVDFQALSAMQEELSALRATAGATPCPVWREDAGGQIDWANSAYLALAAPRPDETKLPSWPPARLFDLTGFGQSNGPVRVSVKGEGTGESWFDLHRQATAGHGWLYLALPADGAVRAERTLKDFMAVLTETFAHLQVGLAIFDSAKRLITFNPALVDMTGLRPEFLIGRPAFAAFLDQLREARMIPEPRDYHGWRQKMQDMESAARGGVFEQDWSLPDRRSFRVSGRPHPGGGMAFVFEDISAEIAATRRQRAEIAMGQAVLDRIDQAVAVFDAGGQLVMTNDAMAALWGDDPDERLATISVAEATQAWAAQCHPSPVWGDLRDFARSMTERGEWTAEIRQLDGRVLAGRFVPLPDGASLVLFSEPFVAAVSGPNVAVAGGLPRQPH